jgi:hypothetical protein
VQGEQRHPLPKTAERGHGNAAAKTALIQLIDGQIGARRAEINELLRVRGGLLGNGRMSTG